MKRYPPAAILLALLAIIGLGVWDIFRHKWAPQPHQEVVWAACRGNLSQKSPKLA